MHVARHGRHISMRQAISHLLACSFSSTIPEQKETTRGLVIYLETSYHIFHITEDMSASKRQWNLSFSGLLLQDQFQGTQLSQGQ